MNIENVLHNNAAAGNNRRGADPDSDNEAVKRWKNNIH